MSGCAYLLFVLMVVFVILVKVVGLPIWGAIVVMVLAAIFLANVMDGFQ